MIKIFAWVASVLAVGLVLGTVLAGPVACSWFGRGCPSPSPVVVKTITPKPHPPVTRQPKPRRPAATTQPTPPPVRYGACTDQFCQTFVAEPSMIDLTADGSVFVEDLTWESWGSAEATASGTLVLHSNACDDGAGCVTGTYPATLVLSQPMRTDTLDNVYSRVLVSALGSPAADQHYLSFSWASILKEDV